MVCLGNTDELELQKKKKKNYCAAYGPVLKRKCVSSRADVWEIDVHFHTWNLNSLVNAVGSIAQWLGHWSYK